MIIEARAGLEMDENGNDIKKKITALQESTQHFSITKKDGTRQVVEMTKIKMEDAINNVKMMVTRGKDANIFEGLK